MLPPETGRSWPASRYWSRTAILEENLMGIYDPSGGLQHRHLPRDPSERGGGQAHRAARGGPLLRHGRGPGREAGIVSAATEWEPVIGLEIHVQLKTKTKMFCGCELSFGDEPNVHTCPVCLGHPGTLPATNEQAVLFALMIAAALECEVAPRSTFHRRTTLPRPAEGLPDQPVRRAPGRRPARRGAHPPRPRRGGRGEAVHKLLGPNPRVGVLARGLQPRRHAAGGDRHRAGHPQRRPGARVGAAAPGDPAPARRLRREHGGGACGWTATSHCRPPGARSSESRPSSRT